VRLVAFVLQGRVPAGPKIRTLAGCLWRALQRQENLRHNRPMTSRDNKYRPDLIGPCSIGQAFVTAADDADDADANAGFCVGS